MNAKSGISPEMAISLSNSFGNTKEPWMLMQVAYELASALKNETHIKVCRQHVKELHV